MRRMTSILLAALLLLGLAGCKESGKGPLPAQSVPTEQAPTQEEIAGAYETAAEAYDWFSLTTMPLDTGDSKKVGEAVYNRVNLPGITSLAELKAYLNTLFVPELTESLLSSTPDHYRDFNGVLYARSADRGENIYFQGKYVKAEQRNDTHWDVTITFYGNFTDNSVPDAPQVTIGYSKTVLDYEKTDTGWRFATFCPSDNLDDNADTMYTFTYDFDTFDHTDFDKYGDFELCCYFLNTDGAFSEMSDALAYRFVKNPERVMRSLVLVEESPWERKDSLISGIGYDAVGFSAYGDRTEFEKLLKNHAAPQSDAEASVWELISAAYQEGSANAEEDTVTPEQEFTLGPLSEDPGNDKLQLGPQEGTFPWGFELAGTPVAQEGGEGYGQIYEVTCGDYLTLRYIETDDGQQILYSMTTTAAQPTALWTHRGVYCGYSEADLKEHYPDELIYLDADHVNPTYGSLGAAYDGAWVYEPGGEAGCRHILFFMKDGAAVAIEVADLIDGRILS
ncbi:hypothetical protein OBV_34010 [Oscillibacter valericigenes Sjm18-20]|nr:hypothetical protein OBV_34010 [Oscillibacter valericigenes Sjm18-20]